MKRFDRPAESGVYRMFTDSGNTYLCIVDAHGKKSGHAYHVFQPRRFASESYICDGWEDTHRRFGVTGFELLTLADINEDGSLSTAVDMIGSFSAANPQSKASHENRIEAPVAQPDTQSGKVGERDADSD